MTVKNQIAAISEMDADERGRTLAYAQGEIYVRANAVAQQAMRIRDHNQPTAEFQADCWLLAEALLGTIRAASLCVLLFAGEHSVEVESAIDRVVQAIPDAKSVRDALEHFDDYLLGIGRTQPGHFIAGQTFERSEHLRIHVGPWTLDVDDAEESALHLASVVLAGRDDSQRATE
jgi:hypothetical protein